MTNILVVDDSSTMRRMVVTSLRQLGSVTFEEASSGLEAIERLALAKVDLLVLDLNMPDIHGLEVLDFVRKYPKLGKIPVIVLTTRGDGDSRAAAVAAGASAYMTKPFVPSALVDQARQLLPSR
jgi:two-component system, chemotaxis family, chemotaxis protein CheY